MEEVTASAPGKCILTGEHSVVYGLPALAVAINMRAKATVKSYEKGETFIHAKQFNKKIRLPISPDKNIIVDNDLQPIYISVVKTLEFLKINDGVEVHIDSSIPDASGLGSSAAVAVATVKAVSEFFGIHLKENEISSLSLESEKIVHGSPSGIDTTISIYGGGILFKKGSVVKVKTPSDIPLIIGDTLKKRNTGKMVSKVRENYLKYTEIFKPILTAMGRISMQAKKYLEIPELSKLGELLNINQALLESLGVSTVDLEKLVYAAREAGAYGAKLTGAGGGGCIVALAPSDKCETVALKIIEAGGKAYITSVTDTGVKIE
ncbi:MAG: mevalonate kinase [Candidatus Odinarchaeum yellowstonii]|uniref:Mevalonate kinase n=1 Tax=Odinarchaeota yellowstonii (strain LCB_4) TaxID=1841599 RepID=A0AAF0D0Z5_ODILC|nr:MAG: mevalonate kinase [Candidatus Odinarchaeum yellowstonii]